MMQPDDELCLCFHVTRRKLENWIRLERPVRPAQLSECFGAGTGCGWCRPFLKRLFQAAQSSGEEASVEIGSSETGELPDAGAYAEARAAYIREGKGKPPAKPEDSPPAS